MSLTDAALLDAELVPPRRPARWVSGAATLFRIRGLRKSFGTNTVLHGIDLDVPRGGVTVLLGPSGSGKSTLLRCINHLERPDAGFVELDGDIIGYRPERAIGGQIRHLRELPDRELAGRRVRQDPRRVVDRRKRRRRLRGQSET